MHHDPYNSHLGSTAVVKLNVTLRDLGIIVKGVPAKVKDAVAEVPG